MARYRYKALAIDGSKKQGEAEAEDERQLMEKLRKEELFCCWYVRVRTPQMGRWRRRMKLKELSFFCHQMSAMIQAGIPVTRAIEICGQTAEENTRMLLGQLEAHIRGGCTLSEAMKEMDHVFPELMVRVTEAGEKSGRLPQLLEKLGERCSRENSLRQKLRNVMTYPLILLAVTAAASCFLFTVVVPQFALLLSGSRLPLVTRVMLKISAFLTDNPMSVLFFCMFLTAAVWGAIQIPAVRLQGSRLLLSLPVAGGLLRISNGARFASSFSILYGSGVDALESMETAGRMMTNLYVRERIAQLTKEVKGGRMLSEVFSEERLFPPAFGAMAAAGEESGQLARILGQAGMFYEEEEQRALEQLLAFLEPAMILLMGLIVGTIVMAVVIPLYSLYSQMM